MDEFHLIFLLFGCLQVLVVGLGAWNLTTTNRLQSRMTKVETLLEASLLGDVKDLKERVSKMELNCTQRHPRHD